MTDGRWSVGIMCTPKGDEDVILYDGQPIPAEDVVEILNQRDATGFSYVNIATRGCEGWLNLFWRNWPIALVNNVGIANQLRERIPERGLDHGHHKP